MGVDNVIGQGESTLALKTETEPSTSTRMSVVEPNGSSWDQSPTDTNPENEPEVSVHSTAKSTAFKKFRIFTILIALYVCICSPYVTLLKLCEYKT
jgi:hypothetical protein